MLQADPQPDLIPKDRHTILPKVENKVISEVSLAALASLTAMGRQRQIRGLPMIQARQTTVRQ